ncbi:unnamed protein product [Boreogadus saida]
METDGRRILFALDMLSLEIRPVLGALIIAEQAISHLIAPYPTSFRSNAYSSAQETPPGTRGTLKGGHL